MYSAQYSYRQVVFLLNFFMSLEILVTMLLNSTLVVYRRLAFKLSYDFSICNSHLCYINKQKMAPWIHFLIKFRGSSLAGPDFKYKASLKWRRPLDGMSPWGSMRGKL